MNETLSHPLDSIRRGFVYRKVPRRCFCCYISFSPTQLSSSNKWVKEYCVCKDSQLLFYKTAESLEPILTVGLYGSACIFITDPKTDKSNSIEIATPIQTVQLNFISIEDTKHWAIAIQKQSLLASGGRLILKSQHDHNAATDDKSGSFPSPN